MPKFFDPVNHPSRSVSQATINGNILTLSGTTTNGKDADIYINGIKNTVHAIVSNTSLTTTAAVWVTANYDFYLTKGFKVSSAAAVITVVPSHDWDTVNRIVVTIITDDTLTGSVTGTFEPDLYKAKTWQVTLNCDTVINRPKNATEGDRIRIEIKNTSSYTVTWEALGFYFVGGAEPEVTHSGITTVEAVVNTSFFPKVDVITLTGSSGTANVTVGGLKKLATFGTTEASLDQTGEDFYTSWVNAYAAIGLTLTEAAGVLTFTAASKVANHYAAATIVNVTTDLAGSVVSTPQGRVQANTVVLDVKQ
jgi:hypothetical protein